MRVILDTNVFISGIFWKGPPRRILESWRDGKIKIVLSSEILNEYEQVSKALSPKYPQSELLGFMRLLALHAEMCDAVPLLSPVSRDIDDDKFFACAITSAVVCIVSGDKDLLEVSGYAGIEVLKPRAFLELYLEKPR